MVPTRQEVLRELKQGGSRLAAVLPIHHPRALLRALGVEPFELWAPSVSLAPADRHLQAYTCGVVRSGLSFLLSAQAEATDVFVIPHACDSLQGLGSVLLDFVKPGKLVLPFYLPRGEGPAARAFLVEELKRFAQALGQHLGRELSDAELTAAVAAEEEADLSLGALLDARAELPLSNVDFYRLARSREYLTPRAYVDAVGEALRRRSPKPRGVPVLLSGIAPEPVGVLEVLDRHSARVVADDLACTGRRRYQPGSSKDPWQRLAEGLLRAPPDSSRGASIEARCAHLRQLAKASGARVAIFFEVKFCEPEQFYLPELRRALEAQGVRSVAVEVAPEEPLPAQVHTRIEALLETAT